jgi:hypothetical protein
MSAIKGHRLLVNLSASQTRRRLKGHGLGVRKVESAGRNQAVVIHTATGDHLRELKGLLRGYVCDDGVGEDPADGDADDIGDYGDDAEAFHASAITAGE